MEDIKILLYILFWGFISSSITITINNVINKKYSTLLRFVISVLAMLYLLTW